MRNQAEANLLALIESTEDLIWSVDLSFRKVFFNRAFQENFKRNYGITPAIGKKAEDEISPERAAYWTNFYQRALTGGPFRTEYPLVDGRTLELSFNPIVVDGAVTGISVFGIDITERKAAEEAAALLTAIVESTDDAIHSTDLQGTIVSWNRGCERLFGYTKEEVLGKCVAFLAPPGRQDEVPRYMAAIAQGSEAHAFDTVLQRKDGTGIEVSLSLSSIRNAAGEIVGAAAIARDITEHKRQERALEEAEKKYRGIFDGAVEGMFQTSPEGKVLTTNPAMARMLGYESTGQLVTSIENVIEEVWADREEWANFRRLIAETGVVLGYECRLRRKDGAVIWGSVSCRRVYSPDGQILHTEGSIQDITKRKAAENAQREAERNYRSIFDGALEGMFQSTLEGKLLAANPALARILGYNSAEDALSSMENVARVAWPDIEVRSSFVRHLEECGAIRGFECQLKRKDGTQTWVSINARLVNGNAGAPAYLEGFIEDINERKRGEEALRESRDSLKEAQTIGGIGTYSLDIRAGVWTSSDTLDEILGIDESYERSVEGWAALVHPDDRETMAEYFANEVIGQKKAFDKEYRVERRRDGAVLWVHGQGRLAIDAEGRPVAMRGVIRDITQRKLATQKLEESEARLRRFFEDNGSVMFLVDPANGKITAANQAASDYYGVLHGTLIGLSVQNMSITPAEEIERNMQIALHTERSGFSYRVRLASGEERDVEAYASALDIDGYPMLFVIVHDVSERKRSEQQLRDSEERYRATFEQAAVGILHVSLDGPILRCNAKLAEIIGYPQNEVPGLTFEQLTPPEDWPNCIPIPQRMSGNCGELSSWEKRYLRRDGSYTWVRLTASTQCDSNGRPLHYIAMVEDINARRAAQEALTEAVEALRESEERYRATFEMSLDAINLNRLSDGVFVDVNDAFLRFVGYNREEVIGRTSRELKFWVDPDDRKRMVGDLRRNSRCSNLEARFRRKDGEVVWGQVSESLIETADGSCILSVTRDISADKAADARLAEAMAALKLSEDRYRTTFQMSLDIISITKIASGEYIDVNQAFLEAGGYQREEVIGHGAEELGVWANIHDRRRLAQEVCRNGACRDLEAQFVKKNGGVFWGRLSASLIEIQGMKCFLSVVRDISAGKAAEERLAAAMAALKSSEAHYRTVFQTSVDGITVSRLSDGNHVDANTAFLNLTGYEREEVVGKTSLELGMWVNPKDRENLVETLRYSPSVQDLRVQYRKKGGEVIWISISTSMIEIEGATYLLSVVKDISATQAAEERLALAQKAMQASEVRYRTAFQTSLDAININRLDDGTYIDCNQAFLDIVGYERGEVLGKTSLELDIWAERRDRENLVEMIRTNLTCRELEAQLRKKNGEVFWGQMSASIIEVDGVPCILSITRDISGAKLAEEEIRNLAFFDPLTRLPNRRLVSERLRQSLAASNRNNRKGALLFIDLDDFKTLNDTLGHKTGDLLLQEVGRRLTACIRDADTVARLGGDEFVVILEDLSGAPGEAAAQVKMVAKKILAAVSEPYRLAGRECLSTSSIGITIFGDRKDAIDDVLQQADIAMYQAKAAGRNTLRFFEPALQTAINARASMEEDLRQAIGSSQFELHYQPQVEAGKVIGAEALLRWNHPACGQLQPGEFIHLAEETGLILPLGNWVLETACQQIAAWSMRSETRDLTLAVNVSARQLRQPDFVDQALNALYRSGANPKNLYLELTESILVENIEEVITKMTVLKAHGVRFSLDDFGTGYSSLSYLKRLPLDQLKIDRAFVRDILADITSGAIAQTVISLSKAMGLTVLAEGVETEQQRELLASLGCHAFQGFLFSGPLPIGKFERLLEINAELSAQPAGS